MKQPNDTTRLPKLPTVGEVPGTMLARVIRRDRLGAPVNAFAIEEIETPTVGPDEVLIPRTSPCR